MNGTNDYTVTMNTTTDYLKRYAEEMPAWLRNYQPGQDVDIEEVRHTRCAYYPGAGDDGCLMKCCNPAHCAHLYILADYWYWGVDEYSGHEFYPEDKLTKLRGYDVIGSVELEDFSKRSITYHMDEESLKNGAPATCTWYKYTPRFKMCIYQRKPGFGPEFGAERLAVIMACYDGIALYDILFSNGIFTNLFMVLNQEHGFGGNYDRFCNLMQKIALRSGVMPPFILTERANLWNGYVEVPTLPIIGGMHRNQRYIYKLADSTNSKHNNHQ